MRKRRWKRITLLGIAALALGAWPVAAKMDRKAPSPSSLVIRVEHGDCLWTVAQRYGNPHRDIRAVIAEIMEANTLPSPQVQPGQELVIPRG